MNGVFEQTSTKSASAAPIGSRSLRWLCNLYFSSAEFLDLDVSTQKVRRRDLENICIRHGHKPYGGMKPRDVAKLRDEKKATPEAAHMVVKSLRQLFKWACKPEYQHADYDPTRDVPYLRSKNPDGFHTWTVEEIKQYQSRHPIGTKARLALDLLLYTGVRKSDVVRLGPQMEPQGWLSFTEAKNRRRKPKHRSLPILPILAHTISQSPSGHLNYLVTEFKKPFSVNGFGNRFKKWCVEAGLPHCSAHGLRKAGATVAAEKGATDRQLMALFGWESAKQPNVYTKQADRKKLVRSAMPLISIEDEDNEASLQGADQRN